MMPTVLPLVSGDVRSVSAPSTAAATAAFLSRLPIEAARSSAVAPSGSSRSDPSGREMVMFDMSSKSLGSEGRGRSAPFARAGAEQRARSAGRDEFALGNHPIGDRADPTGLGVDVLTIARIHVVVGLPRHVTDLEHD